MKQYYFTVASLPFLFFDQQAPLGGQDFLELCAVELSEDQQALLKSIELGNPEENAKLGAQRDWYNWEIALLKGLQKKRAQKLDKESTDIFPEKNDFFPQMEELLRNIDGAAHPLQAEELILKARWDFLNDQEASYQFDINRLVIYYLKLQILLRKASFDRQEGQKELEHQLENILEKHQQTRTGEEA